MAALPLQVLVPGGSASVLTAAAGGGDTCAAGDGVFLEVNNGGGSSVTVTLVTPGLFDGLTIGDRAVAIPAGERWKIPVPRVFAKADGQCDITYSGVTSVTVGCFKVS
ncbi:hypothetical protein [Nonomuraea sp. SYSU D8015]|uniref:hypothetical protein n=1 Tax=Nonomuraea sp. SYSU D8015 TaxID=2593644 RepID=UPI00166070B5|nr:hypothetical protein [Nonomuraea sp. SYSU D8015]